MNLFNLIKNIVMSDKITIFKIDGTVLCESKTETVKEQAQKNYRNLRGADLSSADLRGADLSSADLYGAKNLPQWYINVCARDLLFVFEHLKNELPGLREKLVQGKVNGTQYEGDCACLIGSLANIQDKSTKEVCNYLPFYDMGLHNYGEQWFWNIKEGDTPESNEFSKQAVFLIDMVLAKKPKIAIKKAK